MSEDKDKKAQEEQLKDLQKRIKGLNEELIPLLGKYKLGLGAIPFFAQTDQGYFVVLAKPQWFDDSKPKAEEKVEKTSETGDIAKAE